MSSSNSQTKRSSKPKIKNNNGEKIAPQPPSLERRQPILKVSPRIIIYCEGQTEEFYFLDLPNDIGVHLIDVEAVGQVGVPKTVVEEAIKEKMRREAHAHRRRSDSFEKNFSVWAVFDRDNHDGVPEAMQMAGAAEVKVAYSNPCFELWGMLHLQNHDASDDRHILQKALEEVMPNYDHQSGAEFNYKYIRGNLNDAIERAQTLRRRRKEENNEYGNPFTNVDILVLEMQTSAGIIPDQVQQIQALEAKIENLKAADAFNDGNKNALSQLSECYARLKKIRETMGSE